MCWVSPELLYQLISHTRSPPTIYIIRDSVVRAGVSFVWLTNELRFSLVNSRNKFTLEKIIIIFFFHSSFNRHWTSHIVLCVYSGVCLWCVLCVCVYSGVCIECVYSGVCIVCVCIECVYSGVCLWCVLCVYSGVCLWCVLCVCIVVCIECVHSGVYSGVCIVCVLVYQWYSMWSEHCLLCRSSYWLSLLLDLILWDTGTSEYWRGPPGVGGRGEGGWGEIYIRSPCPLWCAQPGGMVGDRGREQKRRASHVGDEQTAKDLHISHTSHTIYTLYTLYTHYTHYTHITHYIHTLYTHHTIYTQSKSLKMYCIFLAIMK